MMGHVHILRNSVALAALLLGGCGHGVAPETAKQEGTAALRQVAAAKPQRKTLVLTTTQPGRIEAFEETPLFAKLPGYVKDVLVDIGDVVKKNQLLVTLSIPELSDEVAQKEALIAQAQAETKQAEAAIAVANSAAETAQAKIQEAEAGIGRAEAELQRWTSEHARIKELAERGSVPKKLEEETQSQLRAAQAVIQETAARALSARTGWYEAKANIGKAEADLEAAAAQLRVAQADLAHAKTMLSYTQITAPYDGTITRREVDAGHFAQPATGGSAKPLLVIAQSDTVRVFVDIPEMETAYVDVGDPATIRIQAVPGKELKAQVVRTGWSLQESNRSLRAEIDVPNTQGMLRPGMYATAMIELARRENALVIPTSAMIRDAQGTACLTIDAGKAVRLAVEPGLRSGNEVEIVSGIEESQLIVTRPESLKAGEAVEVSGGK